MLGHLFKSLMPGLVAKKKRRVSRMRRLNVRGPLLVGYLIIVTFVCGGLGWASVAPVTKGATVAGALISESKTKTVQHAKGGNVRRIHVREGQRVEAGQLLITLDDSDIREQIRGLQGQLAGQRGELAIVRREFAIIGDLVRRQLTPRPRLVELERQVVQLERDIAGNVSRVAGLETELGRTEVRAPVAGRLLSLAITGTGAVVTPGAVIAEIVPQSDRLVIEGKLAANDIEGVHPGMRAKVWLSALNRRDTEPLKARLAWISPDSIDDKHTGQPQYLVRVILKDTRAQIEKSTKLHAGMRTEILIVKGQTTVLDALLDPLVRSVEKSFRDH